jgi:transposase
MVDYRTVMWPRPSRPPPALRQRIRQTIAKAAPRQLNVLNVRPIFLHNDDRIAALTSIVGLALLIYGLIETDLRQALGPDQHLAGLLPEGRAARPTG